MNWEKDCIEYCDRLSRSLAQARPLERSDLSAARFDRLDHVLENCRTFVAYLDGLDHVVRNASQDADETSNIIRLPWVSEGSLGGAKSGSA